MGYHARLSPGTGGLTECDAAQLAQAGLAEHRAASAPIAGCALRDGQVIRFTLDTTDMAPDVDRVAPEQVAMAVLVLASFFAPLWHLVG
jgi:hypothetical protein